MQKIKQTWRRASVGVRAAIIGAAALVLSSILTAILTVLLPKVLPEPNLKILSVDTPQVDGKAAISVVVWNASEKTQPLTGVELELRQENGLNVIGTSTYTFGPMELDPRSGSIRSSVQDGAEKRISLPVFGFLDLHWRGDWVLGLTVHVQDEVGPSKSRGLVFVLPEAISIRAGRDKLPSMWEGLTAEGVSGNPPRDVYLVRFLKQRGTMGAVVTVTYENAKTISRRTSLTF